MTKKKPPNWTAPTPEDPFRQKERVRREKGPDRQNWMTSAEMVRYLNIDPRTFRRWQSTNKVPPPAARTESGYGLWSPDQQRLILKGITKS